MIAATQSNHPIGGNPADGKGPAIVEEACSRIRASGMRVTKPRVALVEALLKQAGPLSIDKLHQAVGVNACDLVTIYRCLAAFEEIGLVRRSYLHNGTCLYELATAAAAPRYHVVCKVCRKTDPVGFSLPDNADQQIKDKGYSQISHVLEFFGVCSTCREHTSAPARGTSVVVPSRVDHTTRAEV
jgi:Fur family transcriptional regulator, ferric uptake regulator